MQPILLHSTIDSPLGPLLAVGDEHELHGPYMQEGRRPRALGAGWREAREPFARLRSQLGEYFAGERTSFELELRPAGTPFQQRVRGVLAEIPYGGTVSYGELAQRIGAPAASRAVGTANARNPLCVVVPCHRVIGTSGALTGYAGGLERKRLLLDLEARAA